MANEDNNNPVANGNGGADAGPQLTVQKVYIRDSSFEAPGAPHIFQEQGQSRVELNLGQKAQQLAPNVYEIVLTITVTAEDAAARRRLIWLKSSRPASSGSPDSTRSSSTW